jgi:hypothetical protein
MPKKDVVVLRNTQRRPLVFTVAGKTVRLAPGQRMEVPDTWMGSSELQQFNQSGFVKTDEEPARPQAVEADEDGDDEGDDDEKKGRKAAKAAKKGRPRSSRDED